MASRIARWTWRGLLAGSLLGALEAVERTWAVWVFAPEAGDRIAFGVLAFTFVALTGTVVGLIAGIQGAVLDRIPQRARGAVGRAALGLATGGALVAWLLLALTLTVRFDRVIARWPAILCFAGMGGVAIGLAWPALASMWKRARAGPVGALLWGLIPVIVTVHLWNAHFAPQTSFGVHVIADTVLAVMAMLLAAKIAPAPRPRTLTIALAALVLLTVWTDRTMRSRAPLEALVKLRGSIAAHCVRLWSTVLDFDRDGFAPHFLVGGWDPDNLDARVPRPYVDSDAAAVPQAIPAPGSWKAPAIAALRPNVILLTIDACRWDAVPPATSQTSRLGAWLPPTPRLAALRPRAAQFDLGYTPSAGTMDTFGAMFWGLDLPGTLAGVAESRCLPLRLGRAGYALRGYVNDPHFTSGRTWGWPSLELHAHPDGAAMVKAAASFLDSLPRGRPGFAWIHVMDLHADVLAPFSPATFSHRAHLEGYSRELGRVDSIVGTLIDALDRDSLFDRTLLILSADHGEELGGHGHYHHNISLYEPAIRVPLWVMGPDVVPGYRPARVSTASLYPTILETAGVEPGPSSGTSLWPMLDGAVPAVSDPWIYTFLPHRGYSPSYASFERPDHGQAALVETATGHKVILRLGEECWEAYDVSRDSMERKNLAGLGIGWPDSLRARLEAMIQERGRLPQALRAVPTRAHGLLDAKERPLSLTVPENVRYSPSRN